MNERSVPTELHDQGSDISAIIVNGFHLVFL